MRRIIIIYGILMAMLLIYGIAFLFGKSADLLSYPSKLTSEKQVYDGDTLKDVRIQILDINQKAAAGEIWPGVFLTPQDTIEIETDIRLNGIDTPEKRPLKKKRDGTLRSAESRANEKYAAAQSRLALLNLLKDNELNLTVLNPTIGKYAGRIVAIVKVDGMDAAQYLIENGHALPYDGGRKVELDWEKLSEGAMR